MKANLFGAVIASTLLGWAGGSFAQTAPYGEAESAHCNTMTGAQKEQCLRDEANKNQNTQSAASGGTRPPATTEERYGRSPHCDSMTGEAKDKCLEAEARKDENPATSKTGD